MMIGIQNIKTPLDVFFKLGHHGEILCILDLMMSVQFIDQHAAKPVQFTFINVLGFSAIQRCFDVAVQLVQQAAKHHVTVKPKGDQLGIVGVLNPTGTGVCFDQGAQCIWQPVAF